MGARCRWTWSHIRTLALSTSSTLLIADRLLAHVDLVLGLKDSALLPLAKTVEGIAGRAGLDDVEKVPWLAWLGGRTPEAVEAELNNRLCVQGMAPRNDDIAMVKLSPIHRRRLLWLGRLVGNDWHVVDFDAVGCLGSDVECMVVVFAGWDWVAWLGDWAPEDDFESILWHAVLGPDFVTVSVLKAAAPSREDFSDRDRDVLLNNRVWSANELGEDAPWWLKIVDIRHDGVVALSSWSSVLVILVILISLARTAQASSCAGVGDGDNRRSMQRAT